MPAPLPHATPVTRSCTFPTPVPTLCARVPVRLSVQVGAADLHDGLEKLVSVFADEIAASLDLIRAVQLAGIPVLLVMELLFLKRYFTAWMRRTKKEAAKVAELLVQLPQDINVEALLKEARGATARGRQEEVNI